MKRILTILLALTLLLSLAACGDKSNYADNVSVTTLADTAQDALNDGVAYSTADSGYLDDYFTLPDYVTESVIRFATEGNNLNEIGIYHVTEGNAEAMKTILSDYLKSSFEKNQAWYDSYIPQETPKLRDAEVKIYGNYVAYAIFDQEDRDIVFQSIQGALTPDS